MDTIPRRNMLKVSGAAFAGLLLPYPLLSETEEPEDDALLLHEVKVVEEMGSGHYRGLWGNLRCLTEEEMDWRPHPEANSLRWVVGHLNWFDEWVADAIENKGLYLEPKGGPTSFQEPTVAKQKARFDAAHERLVSLMRGLTPADLKREILYVYNEEQDQRPETTIRALLRTHAGHLAGHRYQVRYIRGTYSRAHKTEKACFDPW